MYSCVECFFLSTKNRPTLLILRIWTHKISGSKITDSNQWLQPQQTDAHPQRSDLSLQDRLLCFSSVPLLTNGTEELRLFVRLAVCLFVWSLSHYRFHTCIMYTKMLKNTKSLAFNSSVETLLLIIHLNRCTQQTYRLIDTDLTINLC